MKQSAFPQIYWFSDECMHAHRLLLLFSRISTGPPGCSVTFCTLPGGSPVLGGRLGRHLPRSWACCAPHGSDTAGSVSLSSWSGLQGFRPLCVFVPQIPPDSALSSSRNFHHLPSPLCGVRQV